MTAKKTGTRPKPLWDDVVATLAGRAFAIRHGAYFEGATACVEVISTRSRHEAEKLDLEVIVTPYGKAEVDELKGRRLSLRREEPGDKPWPELLGQRKGEGEFDRCGRAYFSRVPAESVCALDPDRRRAEPIARAAAASPEDRQPAGNPRAARSYRSILPDRLATAELVESGEGTELIVRTTATELDGASVGYRIGEGEGTVVLRPDARGGFSGVATLDQSYDSAVACLPTFTVTRTRTGPIDP